MPKTEEGTAINIIYALDGVSGTIDVFVGGGDEFFVLGQIREIREMIERAGGEICSTSTVKAELVLYLDATQNPILQPRE